jgi:hypothetical protein
MFHSLLFPMRVQRASAVMAAGLFAVACSPSVPNFDAPGVGDVESAFPVVPPAPLSPALLPALSPCPNGWQAVGDAPATCEPWAGGAAPACASDQALFPGAASCTLLGTACTADDWASGLPSSGTILFVKAGATAGGDGSRLAPFATLAAAELAAPPGTIIALSKGTHQSATDIPAGVTLWGACVAQTTLTATASARAAAASSSAGVAVRNLRVSGDAGGLAAVGSGAELNVQDTVVDGALGLGWSAVLGATTTGKNVVVKGTRLTATGTLGDGIAVVAGGRLRATAVSSSGNRTYGLSADGAGSTADLTDAVIADTLIGEPGAAAGVSVGHGASLHLQRAVIERNTGRGLELFAGTVDLVDVVSRDTAPIAGSATSIGAGIISSGTLTASKLWCFGNTAYGVGVYGGTVTLTDAVIDGTLYSSVLQAGVGLGAEAGAAVATRLALRNNTGVGIEANGATGSLLASDLTVTGTLDPPDGTGWGLAVISGGHGTVTRATFDHNHGNSVEVGGQGAILQASDVVVRSTQPYTIAGRVGGGEGLIASQGGSARLDRWRLEQNATAGLLLAEAGTAVTANDLVVEATGEPADAVRMGAGVIAMSGAHLEGTRVEIDGNHFEGLFSTDDGTAVHLTDVAIRDTQDAACPDTMVCARPVGALAMMGGAVQLEHFLLVSNGGFGAVVYGGPLDLKDGDVWGNPIGVDVIDSNYDVSRISMGVRYLFNDRKLDSVQIPLPQLPSDR